MKPSNTRRWITIGLLVVAGAVIVAVSYFSGPLSHPGKVAVSVLVLPTNAALTIDGQPAKAGTVYLSPGKHTASASASGWKPKSDTVNIQPGATTNIDILLDSATNEAEQWQASHQDLYAKAAQRGGQQAATFTKTFEDANPIVKKLPYENEIFTIGYRVDPADESGKSIILTIQAAQGYRNAAIDQISKLGFDPTDYKIEFDNYQDPFSS
jgi:hypothetical protein